MDDAPPARKPPEFHRYRLALLLAVLVPCALLGILIAASIVNDLFLRRAPGATRASTLSADDLLACNRDVRALLEDLAHEMARLELAPLEGDGHDLGADWDAFGSAWDARWTAANRRCRFSELADSGLGTAYDRMAGVYQSLPRAKLEYRERISRFSNDLAGEVAAMRRALDQSRKGLMRAAGRQGQRHE